MFTTLWTDLVIVVIVSFTLGFVIERGLKGLRLGLITLLFNLLPLMLIQPQDIGHLPFHHVTPPIGKFGPYTAPYLVHTYLILEISMGGSLLMGLLGYYTGKAPGAVALQLEVLLATLVCLGFTLGGFLALNIANTTWLLVSAIGLVVPVVLGFVHRVLLGHRTALPLALLWYEICLSCWISYQIAGRVGLLLIALPAQVLLGLALLYVARQVLPPGTAKAGAALQSLLAFLLGDNRPYYVIEKLSTWIEKGLAPRIPGAGRVSATDPRMALVFPGYQAFIQSDAGVEVQAHGVHVHTAGERVLAGSCEGAQLYTGEVEVKAQDGVTLHVQAFVAHRPGSNLIREENGEKVLLDHDVITDTVREVVQEAFKTWRFAPPPEASEEEAGDDPASRLPDRVEAVKATLKEKLTTEGIRVLACGVSGVILPAEFAREREAQRAAQHRQALQALEREVKRRYEGNVRGEETRFFNKLLEELAETLSQAQRSEAIDKDELTQNLLTTLGIISEAPSLKKEKAPPDARSQLLDYYLLTHTCSETSAPAGKGENDA